MDFQVINRQVRPINDALATDRLLVELIEKTPEAQQDYWFRDARAGNVCIYLNEAIAPGRVVEYVMGSRDDSITSLYEANPVLTNRQALIDLRNYLITEIAAATLSVPGAVAFHDHGRQREVVLKEMGTAQLIDQLARIKGYSTALAA